jgi:DNA repair protein RadA/Sms
MRYRCRSCRAGSLAWLGQCPSCGAWGEFEEEQLTGARSARAARLCEVPVVVARRVSSGLRGLDQLLGGGLVAGSVVLVSGEPGIGKSSLALAMCRSSEWMVVSSEETLSQLVTRARRLGIDGTITALATRDLDEAIAELMVTESRYVVVDSLHALAPSQQALREATDRLVRVAKQRELTIVAIGQVAKDGDPLGPRYVEHMVDVSLMVEATSVPGVRRVIVRKNRFGPGDGIRRFALGEAGVEELEEERVLPSVLHPGQAFAAILVGGRPCLVEIDAMGKKTKNRKKE